MRLEGKVIGAPGKEEEQPHDRDVRAPADLLHRVDILHRGKGQDEWLASAAFDADSLPAFDHREAFARLVSEFLLAFAEHVIGGDEGRAH